MHQSIVLCMSIFLSCLSAIQYAQCTRPTARTVNGPVEGIYIKTTFGQIFHAFKSIPYAKPPITGRDPYTGEMVDRRFKAPEIIDRNWNEPLKVVDYGKKCMQEIWNPEKCSEDCLTLNVFVPAGGAERKTVIVYIHGGSFAYGGGPVGPDFLLSLDNVVVNIQYRLGIFGFLNLGYGEYTGNMGLKDQQLALKWIHENIENFSGNKDEILVIGQSAGGASLHYHMLNEKSRQYFNRAYPLSSSAFSPYALRKINHVQHIQNCSQLKEMSDLIEYAKTADAATLRGCYPFTFPGRLNPVWVPTIESPDTVGAFMTKTPDEIYSSGSAPAMDVLFSFDSKEMIAFFQELLNITEPLIKDDLTVSNERIFQLPYEGVTESTHPNVYKYALKKLREAYYPNVTSADAIRDANIALMSDMTFTESILKAVVLQSDANSRSTNKSQHKNTFVFRFSVNTELKNIVYNKTYEGATHGDDLPYIFMIRTLGKMKVYGNSLKTKDHIFDLFVRTAKIITNFARTGNPSIDDDTPFEPCKSSNEIYLQEVSNELKTRITYDIKEQLHYFVWRDIEKAILNKNDTTSSNSTSSNSTSSNAGRPSQGFLLDTCIISVICIYSVIQYFTTF